MATLVRARTGDGRSFDDPSDADLASLVAELDPASRSPFLIVEKISGQPPGQYYSQVLRIDSETWQVEYRAGGPESHFQARVSGPYEDACATVARVISGWARDRPGWREGLAWTPLSPGQRRIVWPFRRRR